MERCRFPGRGLGRDENAVWTRGACSARKPPTTLSSSFAPYFSPAVAAAAALPLFPSRSGNARLSHTDSRAKGKEAMGFALDHAGASADVMGVLKKSRLVPENIATQ